MTCGYSQIPGIDFHEHFAPVIHDITWRILIVCMMIWMLDAWLIDVETAFLHGEFEDGKRLFMDVPDGWREYGEDVDQSNDCVELLKTIYGISQASRAFYKFISRILRDIGFEGGDADPCLVQWKSPYGIVMVGIYVDDLLCVGKPKAPELL